MRWLWWRRAEELADFDNLEERTADALRRLDCSRNRRATQRDRALGADTAGLWRERDSALRMVESYSEDVELHLGTAQALRNEQRLRGYAVRKASR